MKASTVGFAVVAAAQVLAAGAARAEGWDMPTAYPASNYHTETAVAFAACVKGATAGKFDITVHPNGALFKGNDIKRAVQTGQAPIGERLISAHANENPLFGVDSIPFLASSFEASEKLWKAALPELEKLLASQNLVYVYAVPWPPQGLYTKKAVNSVADLKGVKFRSYSVATARIAELSGMIPVQIEAADLSQALATGVADSFISSGSTGFDVKAWEYMTHFYTVDAWLPRNVIFANKDSFDKLSASEKAAVKTCGDTAAASGLAQAKALTQKYIDALAANKMTVSAPGAQLKSELDGYGKTMTGEWEAKAGAAGKAIVDAYSK
ncbi:TRAP transporter substrate-binding protein [Pinisolibacter aquiterrae]|uniref:TRAP transporter substrate-binding protein n=1 Tax=Pinisolibacter aquiterrae TaxID=2815579 RepID=UPI001C3CBCF7|nr:TRAP transporter substrate-binding protein [Pinisolibacter aquiterrae]MBV5263748.1 TRAP transporter substrate-binding protein [Pinisolibacter aquiterrae]MCC8235054.1 TRAP transporter substrate-binding protein [Pinisolibacter aquiterrae]